MVPTIGSLLDEARHALAAASFKPSTREAALLLGRVLSFSEAQVLARVHEAVAEEEATAFQTLLSRRLGGEPVAYLFGEKEFYGRPFTVDRRVLIPRPETEHLVEAALDQTLPPQPRILDVGTGSGAIAVTLALEHPAARIVATDLSPAALAVAAQNAGRHQVETRVRLVATDLFLGLEAASFDLVLCNPPYVDECERQKLSPEVRDFEPPLALFAPGSGDSVLGQMIQQARSLRRGVPLVLEIGQGQLDGVRRLVEESAHLTWIAMRQDYAQIPRIVVLRRQ